MVEEYHFGSITIDGKTYEHDVEVRCIPKPSGQAVEVLKWWRKEGHLVDVDDLKRAITKNPEVIIIGTGHPGMAKVANEAQDFIRGKGIELIIDTTEEATKTFNIICEESEEEEGEQKKVIGLFHLTC